MIASKAPIIFFISLTFLACQKEKSLPTISSGLIKGKVEIDGHTVVNDKIKFEATLRGVRIYDSERDYEYRECDKDSCTTIHLVEKYYLPGTRGMTINSPRLTLIK